MKIMVVFILFFVTCSGFAEIIQPTPTMTPTQIPTPIAPTPTSTPVPVLKPSPSPTPILNTQPEEEDFESTMDHGEERIYEIQNTKLLRSDAELYIPCLEGDRFSKQAMRKNEMKLADLYRQIFSENPKLDEMGFSEQTFVDFGFLVRTLLSEASVSYLFHRENRSLRVESLDPSPYMWGIGCATRNRVIDLRGSHGKSRWQDFWESKYGHDFEGDFRIGNVICTRDQFSGWNSSFWENNDFSRIACPLKDGKITKRRGFFLVSEYDINAAIDMAQKIILKPETCASFDPDVTFFYTPKDSSDLGPEHLRNEKIYPRYVPIYDDGTTKTKLKKVVFEFRIDRSP